MKTKRPSKQSIRLAIISGIVLICIVIIAIPFFGANKEEDKFRSLSSTMKSVYTSLQTIDSSSSWRYKESCSDVYTGDFPTGDIVCSIELSLQTSVTSASTMKELHQSYYNVIINSPNFLPEGTLTLSPASSFGKKFVVSTAEARYTIKDLSGISCRYNLALGQQDENSTNSTIGESIETSVGTLLTTFLCDGLTTNYWYTNS